MRMHFKNTVLASAWALVALFAATVKADDLLNQSLGSALNAFDYFQVTCSNDGGGTPHHVSARVRDKTAGANVLHILVHRGVAAKKTSDATGANTTYSPTISVASGTIGTYDIFVGKTNATTRVYDLEAHCVTATGGHTGTSIVTRVNQ
jgi:hypothetical protein